jgi:hypothetical protein
MAALSTAGICIFEDIAALSTGGICIFEDSATLPTVYVAEYMYITIYCTVKISRDIRKKERRHFIFIES